MASYRDYIGVRFPPFVIEEHIGSGRDAEVYRVRHEGTGRSFALRLPGNDERFWEGAPLTPPLNASFELHGARVTFAANTSGGRKAFPEMYGIRDGRFLVALTAPWRVAGSLDVETIIDLTPPGFLSNTEYLEDLTLGAVMLLSNKSSDDDSVMAIAASPLVAAGVRTLLASSSLPREMVEAVYATLVELTPPAPVLEENLLIRLCTLVWNGSAPLEAAGATASCEHFRNNVTAVEIAQFYACCHIQAQGVVYAAEDGVAAGPAKYRLPILQALSRQPLTRDEDHRLFAVSAPSDLLHETPLLEDSFKRHFNTDRFGTILQELVAEQPFLTFETEL